VSGAPDGKPDALLLDEMFPPQIAAELALRGVDCRAVVVDPVLRAQSDLEIFPPPIARRPPAAACCGCARPTDAAPIDKLSINVISHWLMTSRS
jgi:hypothetical protein